MLYGNIIYFTWDQKCYHSTIPQDLTFITAIMFKELTAADYSFTAGQFR